MCVRAFSFTIKTCEICEFCAFSFAAQIFTRDNCTRETLSRKRLRQRGLRFISRASSRTFHRVLVRFPSTEKGETFFVLSISNAVYYNRE